MIKNIPKCTKTLLLALPSSQWCFALEANLLFRAKGKVFTGAFTALSTLKAQLPLCSTLLPFCSLASCTPTHLCHSPCCFLYLQEPPCPCLFTATWTPSFRTPWNAPSWALSQAPAYPLHLLAIANHPLSHASLTLVLILVTALDRVSRHCPSVCLAL